MEALIGNSTPIRLAGTSSERYLSTLTALTGVATPPMDTLYIYIGEDRVFLVAFKDECFVGAMAITSSLHLNIYRAINVNRTINP